MTHSNDPLVSIVMPTLNQADFIEESVNSVLGQSYTCLELIVVDGGSTDRTLRILRKLQKKDARLIYFHRKDNGPAFAINYALKKVQGSIIGWLNSDDLYAPCAIYNAVKLLTSPSNLLMVYGQGQHIDQNGNTLKDYPTLPPSTPIRHFQDGCFICQPTVFFKYSMVILLGKLDETLQTAFDFDYWLRAFLFFPKRIGFINQVVACSRLHKGCITMRMRRTVALEGVRVLKKNLGRAPYHWIFSYIVELWEGDGDINSKLIRSEIISVIEVAKAWLEPNEINSLKKQLMQDERFEKLKI